MRLPLSNAVSSICAPGPDLDSYTTYVIDDAEATYASAYFELNYINVFSTSTSGGGGGGGGSSSTNPSATTTVSSGPGSSSSGASGADNSPNAALSNKRFRGVAGLTMGGVVGGLAVGLMGMVGVGLVL